MLYHVPSFCVGLCLFLLSGCVGFGICQAQDQQAESIWLRYRMAVEKIKDFECEMELQRRPSPGLGLIAERGAVDRGQGFLLLIKYQPFRWSADQNKVFLRKTRFYGGHYPPHDWLEFIVFSDGKTSGFYNPFQASGGVTKSPPDDIAFDPSPPGFLKPHGSNLRLIEKDKSWRVVEGSENRFQIILPYPGTDGWLWTIDIDPKHGFLPNRMVSHQVGNEATHADCIVDEFVQVNGIWFPSTMRVEHYEGTAWGSLMSSDQRVVVDKDTLKLNQGFGSNDFQFQFPENIMFSNEITGEYREPPEGKEIALAFAGRPVRESLPVPHNPVQARKLWVVWIERFALMLAAAALGFAVFWFFWFWRRRSKQLI